MQINITLLGSKEEKIKTIQEFLKKNNIDSNDLVDSPKPLHITEDGVSIYEFNKYRYYWLLQNKSTGQWKDSIGWLNLSPGHIPMLKPEYKEKYKLFVEKEAALKWMEQENEKLALFRTEDNILIYPNDEYYILELKDNYMEERHALSLKEEYKNFSGKNEYKYFSTEKAAKEYIESIKPKPIFRTLEGIDMYVGDTYFYTIIDEVYPKVYQNTVLTNTKYNTNKENSIKYFSTKENAEDYIIMNKASFSVNDINTIVYLNSYALQQLKNKAKEKLKL